MSKYVTLCVSLAVVLSFGAADARNFRMGMLPTRQLGAIPANVSGGGSPRNAFGLAVEARVTAGGREAFWDASLAAMDSDGDGFTDGQELGDPDGDGTPNPLAKATHPGDATDFPQSVALDGPRNQAKAVVTVTQNGSPVAGATVSLSRSISGVAPNYAWSATTNANGIAIVDISVTRRSASGYYLVRATNAAGAVIAQRGSVPINGAQQVAVAVSGGSATKVASLGNAPNPFNPATTIHYTLSDAGLVKLTVFNALGQEVTRLAEAFQAAGSYSVAWQAQDVASGLYYYRLEVDGVSEIRKMLLLK